MSGATATPVGSRGTRALEWARTSPGPRTAVVAALVPWSWYVWRDLPGGLDGGFLQTVLDLTSLLLPVGALVLVLVGAALSVRSRWCVVPAASGLVFAIVATSGPWRSTSAPVPVDPIRLAHANLLLDNRSLGAVDDLLRGDPDIVVTSETNGDQYLALSARLGEPIVSAGDDGGCSLLGDAECGTVNVWSRLPARVAGDQRVAERVRGVRLEVDAPGGPVVVYAVHVRAPAPFGVGAGRSSFADHRADLDALLDAARGETDPVIVVGDLNLSDRESGYRDFTGALRDAMRAGGDAGPTGYKWYLRPLLVRVDHVFVSPSWCSARADRFTVSGSDHRGVRADLGRCAAS